MARGKSKKISIDQTEPSKNYLEKVTDEVSSNQSKLSMVLGALIVLVLGVLVFNYFNKSKPDLGPAQNTQQEDVSPDKLPGKYTVKENDTLFEVAEKYYQDGYKYSEIAKANSLTNPDMLETGQILEIPKLETEMAEATEQPSSQPSQEPVNIVPAGEKGADMGTGTGGGNTTIWGPKIDEDSYTVVEGDWLSTIAGRTYGDIYAYNRIAEANNIKNPDLIEPGTILKIPR